MSHLMTLYNAKASHLTGWPPLNPVHDEAMNKTLITTVISVPEVKKGAKAEDLSGKVFGRLTVIGLVGIDSHRRTRWLCDCICGNQTNSLGQGLKNGTASSCGCYAHERRVKHGDAKGNRGSSEASPEYVSFTCILRRCLDLKCPEYQKYGAVGIKTFWDSYEKYPAFLSHIGRRPTPQHTVDRFPNRRGHYEPGNVRWATPRQQAENRESSVFLTYRGETHCLSEWARRFGINKGTLRDRIKKGWSVENSLLIPPFSPSQAWEAYQEITLSI